MQGKMMFAEMKLDAWNVSKLASLGVDEEKLAAVHPTKVQIRDLFKGLLYLREMYPEFWGQSSKEKI
jgi:hypothetical protein